MDHVLVSLLNTASEKPDPLDSALGAARWWSSMNAPEAAGVTIAGKPHFDAALAQALRGLRDSLHDAVTGGTGAVRFTGTSGDRVLFHIAAAAVETFAAGRSVRIKRCAEPACPLYFLDATKNRSRRWCSLRCMEKSRVPRRRTIPA